MKSYKFLFFVLLFAQVSAFGQSESDMESLYQGRHFFELRDALLKSKDRTNKILFYRAVVENKFNRPEKSAELLKQFLKKETADKKKIVESYELLADSYTKTYEYGKAADAYGILIEKYNSDVSTIQAIGYQNVRGLWEALRNAAPQKVSAEKDTLIAATRDKAKLLNVPVEIGTQKMDFVFDTGANLSTITLSTAEKLGLKIIEADVSVGSSTNNSVKSKLAVAPELKIGNAVIKNVVFLVLENKALYFPQIDYQINGIIGFPVIKSLGRITLSRDDKIMFSAKKDDKKVDSNMLLDGLMPLVSANYKGKRMIFVFDTGATTSSLYAPFYEEQKDEIIKASQPSRAKFGGAGGSQEITVHRLKNLTIEVGGRTATFPEITVATENYTNQRGVNYYGTFGQTLIKQFERMTIDFEAMRLTFD